MSSRPTVNDIKMRIAQISGILKKDKDESEQFVIGFFASSDELIIPETTLADGLSKEGETRNAPGTASFAGHVSKREFLVWRLAEGDARGITCR